MHTSLPTLITVGSDLTQKSSENLHLEHNSNIALDLSNTQTIDIKGISALLAYKNRLVEKGFDAVLINPKPSIRTLLYATQLNKILHSFTNLNSANQYFLNQPINAA